MGDQNDYDPRVPKRIWLLPETGIDGETTWCNSPNPGGLDDHEVDAVEYVQVGRCGPGLAEDVGEGKP